MMVRFFDVFLKITLLVFLGAGGAAANTDASTESHAPSALENQSAECKSNPLTYAAVFVGGTSGIGVVAALKNTRMVRSFFDRVPTTLSILLHIALYGSATLTGSLYAWRWACSVSKVTALNLSTETGELAFVLTDPDTGETSAHKCLADEASLQAIPSPSGSAAEWQMLRIVPGTCVTI